MTFDVSTITFAGGVVSFAGGLVLLMNWLHDRAARAAFWWAAANCALGVGVTGLALHAALPAFASNVAAPLILDASVALAWVAARIFNRGSVKGYPLVAAAGALIAPPIFAAANADAHFVAALGAVISGCFYAAAAIEFWLAREENLRGRWPMIFLLGLEAVALFLAAVDFSSSTLSPPTPTIGWFGIIHFVGLVYAVGSAALPVMMLKERSEAKHKAIALIDPLTGLANRRAFMERAQRLFERNGGADAPVSLLAFDLDSFKRVNDAFGHPTGDDVLRIFANVLSKALRPADIAARIGGEEFAAALPDCGVEAALAIARRICNAFQNDARFVNGQRVVATVSVGVAVAAAPASSLADTLASADRALYQAKDLGRNRVVLAHAGSHDSDPSAVVRIA
jgi:diguanylate cyclase (GGDEF)-like protein